MTAAATAFAPADYLPQVLYNQIVDVRITQPERIAERAAARKRRKQLAPDGHLVIVAADHPARGVVNVGANPIAMGNRHEYLARIIRALTAPNVDGVMATPDLIDDLLILDSLLVAHGGQSFLDERVILGCLNRGGLRGVSWEMDDLFTAYTPASLKDQHLDGAKLMFRLDPQDPASGRTILACAQAINGLNALDLPAFLEPLPVVEISNGYRVLADVEHLVQVVGIASGLGDSSKGLWLKLPVCNNFGTVAGATTCPILLLGGESKEDPTSTLTEFATALRSGANVRGALVGRNVLFPGTGRDPYTVAEAMGQIIHRNLPVERAVELSGSTGADLDRFKQ